MKLQDFSDTNAALWPVINEFYENLPEPTFFNSGSLILQPWKEKSSMILYSDGKTLKILQSPRNLHWQSTVQGHQGTLKPWLRNVIYTDIFWTVHANFLCVIPVATNSVSEYGQVQTSSLELQNFNHTNAALWPMISELYENPQGSTFPNLDSLEWDL
jgi:hypothetical protein